MKKRFRAIIISAFILAGFAGCSSRSKEVSFVSTDESYSSNGYKGDSAAGIPNDYYSVSDGIYESESTDKGSYSPEKGSISSLDVDNEAVAGRKIIYTANMNLKVEEGVYEDSVKGVKALANSLGGYIESSSTNSYYRTVETYLTVRVPVEKYDEFVNTAGQYGKIQNFEESSQDITSAYADTRARLEVKKAERDRLTALLNEANTVTEVLEIERRLSEVQEEIESTQARLNTYDNKVSYCTVYITLTAELEIVSTYVEKTFGEKLSDAVKNGFGHVVDFFEGGILFVAEFGIILVLWILVIALIVKGAIKLFRKFSKKKSKKSETAEVEKAEISE